MAIDVDEPDPGGEDTGIFATHDDVEHLRAAFSTLYELGEQIDHHYRRNAKRMAIRALIAQRIGWARNRLEAGRQPRIPVLLDPARLTTTGSAHGHEYITGDRHIESQHRESTPRVNIESQHRESTPRVNTKASRRMS